jgi:hypothetical protein
MREAFETTHGREVLKHQRFGGPPPAEDAPPGPGLYR